MTAIAGIRVGDLARELKMTPRGTGGATDRSGRKGRGAECHCRQRNANTVREMLGKPTAAGKVAEVGPNPTVQEIADAMGIPANDGRQKNDGDGRTGRAASAHSSRPGRPSGRRLRLHARAKIGSQAASRRRQPPAPSLRPSTKPRPEPCSRARRSSPSWAT